MRPRTAFLLMLLVGLIIGAEPALSQPKWQPAVSFSKSLGQVTYLPGLGEKGYVHCWYGPDGVRYGIYDLKTLSDTSKVLCELPGPVADRRVFNVFDADGDGQQDALAGLTTYMSVCRPSQRNITIELYTGFDGGFADLDGNGRPEYLAHYTVPNLITLNDSGTAFWKWAVVPSVPRKNDVRAGILHFGTLSGKVRFLTNTLYGDGSGQYVRWALETLDPSQLNPANDSLRLATVHVFDGVMRPGNAQLYRLFMFPDAWYLPRSDSDSMIVITADTIVSVKKDPSLGDIIGHHGQLGGARTADGYSVIDGTRLAIIAAGNPVHLRYVRLHAEGTRLWAEDIDSIFPSLEDGIPRVSAETAVVGDIDSDGLADVIVTAGTEAKQRSFLYLTTGRFLTSVLNGSTGPPVQAVKTMDGWTVSLNDCNAMRTTRATVYDVRGTLITMIDMVPMGPLMWRIPTIALPTGAAFAVVGSCVVRLQ